MTFAPQEPWEQKTTRPTARVLEAARGKRTRGEDPVPAPGHSTKHLPNSYRDINGWGADLDRKNRPSYPKELPSDVKTAYGDAKHWQTPHTKVHVSNEHAGLTPVFGEAVPPKGLSGLLRDFAYQYGEATNRHWMTLLLADRVNVIESAIADGFTGSDPRKKAIFTGAATIGAIAIGLAIFNAIKESD